MAMPTESKTDLAGKPYRAATDVTGPTGQRLPTSPHFLYQRMRTMDRRRLTLGLLLPTAIMVLMAWTPGHADDIGANKTELIRGLLATVVNISTRKDEVSRPASASASTTVAAGTTTAADAGSKDRSGARMEFSK